MAGAMDSELDRVRHPCLLDPSRGETPHPVPDVEEELRKILSIPDGCHATAHLDYHAVFGAVGHNSVHPSGLQCG